MRLGAPTNKDVITTLLGRPRPDPLFCLLALFTRLLRTAYSLACSALVALLAR